MKVNLQSVLSWSSNHL